MKFKNLLKFFFAAAICIGISGVLYACGGDDADNDTPGKITISKTNIIMAPGGGEVIVDITTPSEWDARTSDSWISLVKSDQLATKGTVRIDIANNPSRNARTGSVIVLSKGTSATINIIQDGKEPEPVDPSISVPDGYELVWNDEFDGNELNRSDWTHEVQGSYWVNNELQNYVNTSFDGKLVTEVSDGTLKINCFKASNGKIYSGRIYAHVNEGWRYGVFEARIKLPKGKGTWPAFWMMPVNNDWNTTPWPKCGEIDIMEEVGCNPNYTSSSIHCESYNHVMNTQKTAERYTAGAEDDFHIYRLEWTPDYIRTYVDGNPLLNFANDGKNNISTWPFNRAFYLILNLAWGGDWGGMWGVDENALPATMTVDYVRVFQKP